MIRKRFQRLPLPAKLRFVISWACIVVILATGGALMVAEFYLVRHRMIEALRARVNVLSLTAMPAVTFRNPTETQEILTAAGGEAGVNASLVIDASGAEFARHLAPGAPPIPPARQQGAHYFFTLSDLTYWTPMQTPDGRVVGMLGMRMSLALVYQRLTLFGGVTLLVIGAAILLTLLLSRHLGRLLAEPILSLAAAADRVTSTRDYTLRVPVGEADEVGRLARAFNVMLQTVESSQSELARRVEERTAELQRAYRELEGFSYSVSHDLRAPLRTISGFTETILEDASSRLSPDSLQHSQRILAAVSRMNRLIDGLLDLSRVAKRELHFSPINMDDLAREVVAELTADPGSPGTDITIDPLPPCVGDPILIRQVLVNLVGNAVKYSRNQAAPAVVISAAPESPEGHHTYRVADNGAGFDMQHASRLFQPFERMHEARQFEGTGIGLATSRRIIERHGGRIWAESAPNEGATFRFTLPAALNATVTTRTEIAAGS